MKLLSLLENRFVLISEFLKVQFINRRWPVFPGATQQLLYYGERAKTVNPIPSRDL